MKQIGVRLAALVIVASILPLPGIRAQGQSVITSQITDSTWRYFPCASGIIEKRERARLRKVQRKEVIKAGDSSKSRRAERRL
jgi:hypothetical protein